MEFPVIQIIQGEEVENEFDIHPCCAECSKERYKWTVEQHNKIRKYLADKRPLTIPATIKTSQDFIAYVRTL